MKAVGIHVFAGGFTVGVQRVFDVAHQLEVHGFGLESAAAMCGIEAINCPAKEWPKIDAEFAFGNPRCTGFSTITSGYGGEVHGPFAKATCDIREFCDYVVAQDYPIAIWESVQQAYTVGKPLLDFLVRDVFAPKGYRVAHVFVNAGSFQNAQQRKRYFFVAYKADRNFNVEPPEIWPHYATTYDAIYDMRDRVTKEGRLFSNDYDYDEDTHVILTDDERESVKWLPNGWDLNWMGRAYKHMLPPKFQKAWELRTSDMPFSMHGVVRLNWFRPFPTIHSSAGRFIHPEFHRPVTVGELSKVMGWPRIPVGKNPIAQIAKGVCPDVGEWLAKQAYHYLNDAWGSEDYESSYCGNKQQWVGRDTTGEREKVFNLTSYVGQTLDPDYNHEILQQHSSHLVQRRWELAQRTAS